MWSYEREQARLQEMLEILNDEEGQGLAYDEHSDIDQSDGVDHVEEQHDNSDSEQDISDDGEMVEESHSNTLSFIGKDKVTRWRKLASHSITSKTTQTTQQTFAGFLISNKKFVRTTGNMGVFFQ
ncbi:hypothetical protein JTB14_011718 [Gonioctena quinquepunctata]|nr:hypothetical protein JTB14_011718 [Gonioctena quinquepunctata]